MNPGNGMDKSSVLTCWKDIAKYMGKGVRTVQRWEEEFGLPVRRPTGSNKKAVLARTSDLDAWVALRCGARNHAPAVSDGQHSASIMRLTALSAQLETSRQLQSHNRELLVEMCTALDALRQQILSLQVGQ